MLWDAFLDGFVTNLLGYFISGLCVSFNVFLIMMFGCDAAFQLSKIIWRDVEGKKVRKLSALKKVSVHTKNAIWKVRIL